MITQSNLLVCRRRGPDRPYRRFGANDREALGSWKATQMDQFGARYEQGPAAWIQRSVPFESR
jgi:hypothetical protein